MKIDLWGKKQSRKMKQNINEQLMKVAASSNEIVDPQAMYNVVTSLLDHIEDLEDVIFTATNTDNSETNINMNEAHFDKDLFSL